MELMTKRQRPVTVNEPSDPALATLWRAAMSKFAARTGREAANRDDLREVIADYQHMVAKPRGSIEAVAQLLREHCAQTKTPGG